MSLGALLVAAASQAGAVLFAVMAAVMGLALGPTFVAIFTTAGDLAPAHMAAETQAWMNSFMSLGGAVGTTVAGLVSQSAGPGAVLVVAAASMAAASGAGPPRDQSFDRQIGLVKPQAYHRRLRYSAAVIGLPGMIPAGSFRVSKNTHSHARQ